MKTYQTVAVAMLAGFGLGVTAIETLRAQGKAPIYLINEIEVTNADAYGKEYAPLAQAQIKAAGGRFIVAGGKTKTFEGDPPKSRVVVQVWDSMEKIEAWRNSADYKQIREIGNKHAKFRTFAVDGVAQ